MENLSNSILNQSFDYSSMPYPSAPPMDDDISVIHWNTLPSLDRPLKWHEVTRIRQIVANVLFGLGAVTAAITTFSATWLTASAQTILLASSSFGLITLALVATSVALHCMKKNPLDTAIRQASRNKIKKSFENHQQIPCYKSLAKTASNKVLTQEEIQNLLRRDILNLEFNAFINKHTNNVLKNLNDENKGILKSKYLFYIISNCTTGLKDILNAKESQYFGITEQEIAPIFANYEIYRICHQNRPYSEFISRNGYEMIHYVTDLNSRQYLIQKFNDEVLQATRGEGSIMAEKQFSKDFEAFGEDVKIHILKNVVAQHLLEQQEGSFNYQSLRLKNSPEYLDGYILASPNIQAEMRKAFLKMPYTDMKNFGKDQTLLKLSDDEIKSELFSRWVHLPIVQILNHHADDFFATLDDGIFSPSDWTSKVYEDLKGYSLSETLKFDSRLFSSHILGPNTLMPSGKKFSEELEKEIFSCKSFEELLENYTSMIFSLKLCSPSHPTIARLAVNFINVHAKNYLLDENLDKIANVVKIIEDYSLLGESKKRALQMTKNSVTEYKQNHLLTLEQIRRNHREKIDQLTIEMELAKQNLKKMLEIDFITYISEEKKNNQKKAESFYENQLICCQKLETELSSLTDQLTLLSGKIKKLNQQKDQLGTSQSTEDLEKEIKFYETKIKSDKIEIKQKISTDTILFELNKHIKELEEKIESETKKIVEQKQFEALCSEQENLTKELIGSNVKKEALRAQIDEINRQKQETQGLLSAIKAYSTSTSPIEKEIQSIEEKEARLLKIDQTIDSFDYPRPIIDPLTLSGLNEELKSYQMNRDAIYAEILEKYSLPQNKSALKALKVRLGEVISNNQKIELLKREISKTKDNLNGLTIQKNELEKRWTFARDALLKDKRLVLEAEQAAQEADKNLEEALKSLQESLQAIASKFEGIFLAHEAELKLHLQNEISRYSELIENSIKLFIEENDRSESYSF